MTFYAGYCVLTLLFLFLHLLTLPSKADNEADYNQHEISSSGEFTLTGGRNFSLVNAHRPGEPTLHFYLQNGTINPSASEWVDRRQKTTRKFALLFDGGTLKLKIVHQYHALVSHFTLTWEAPSNKPERGVENSRELCFHLQNRENGGDKTFWYSTYQSSTPSFPIATNKSSNGKIPFNYLHDLRATRSEYALILEHLFLNTDGFALLANPDQPLFLRKTDNQLCFSADQKLPYSARNTDDRTYLTLKMHIFASKNIRTVTNYVVHNSGYLPRPSAPPDESLFSMPLWQLLAQDGRNTEEGNLEHFIEQIRAHRFFDEGATGQLQLTSNWKIDDLLVNRRQLPNLDEKLETVIHSSGLCLLAPVVPNPVRYTQTTQKYFIKNSTGGKINYVDFSNHRAAGWFSSLLGRLHYEDGLDAFFLDTQSFSPDLMLYDSTVEKYPNRLITLYLEAAAQVANGSCTRVAFKTQHLPLFLQLTGNIDDQKTGHEMLKSLVSSALTVSIGGYSWILPFRVGTVASTAPSEELYIRWLQAVALMPRMAIHTPPWEVSPRAVEAAREMIQLHKSFKSEFVKLAKSRVEDGHPIVRPLWYEAPEDVNTYSINDQFMLGNSLLVAPVLEEGVTRRKVYFPHGTWADGKHPGQVYTGERWNLLDVPKDRLLYFKKTAD